jgi:hypothetical protein
MSTSPASDDVASPDGEAAFPFGLMLLCVVAVFCMPVVVLVYAAHTAAHHAPSDLPAVARQAVQRGQTTQAHFVSMPDSTQPPARRPGDSR